jgi:hypothetical protein
MKTIYSIQYCKFHKEVEIHADNKELEEYPKCGQGLGFSSMIQDDDDNESIIKIEDSIHKFICATAKDGRQFIFNTLLQEEVERFMSNLDFGCRDYSLSFVTYIENADSLLSMVDGLNKYDR